MKNSRWFVLFSSALLFASYAVARDLPHDTSGQAEVSATRDFRQEVTIWMRDTNNLERFDASSSSQCMQGSRQAVEFGLSKRQRQRLYELSGAQIDWRYIYRLTLATADDLQECRQADGYLGDAAPILSPISGVVAEPVDEFFDLSARSADADPGLMQQWWLEALRVPDAWQMATGKGVIIADCDSGFFTREPDLANNLLIDERRDFADTRRPTVVDDGQFVFHGTAVAAILAGVRDGRGTNGIAFDSKVIPLQNFNYDRSLDNADKEEATARCVLHALQIPGVRIILVENQTPQGSSETFTGTRDAIRLAVNSGISVVSAAGNSSLELQMEEQYDSGSIIVGAVRRNHRKALFSNWGARVTISAFGEGVRTLYGQNGQLEIFGGTTAAAAQVAAAIALMLDINPQLTPAQVRSILLETRKTASENAAVGGVLDVYEAVLRARDLPKDEQTLLEQAKFRKAIHGILGST